MRKLVAMGVAAALSVACFGAAVQYTADEYEAKCAAVEALAASDVVAAQLCLGVDGYNAFVKEYNGEN